MDTHLTELVEADRLEVVRADPPENQLCWENLGEDGNNVPQEPEIIEYHLYTGKLPIWFETEADGSMGAPIMMKSRKPLAMVAISRH